MTSKAGLMRWIFAVVAVSCAGGILGSLLAAIGRYIAYPALRYDSNLFVSDVLSGGSVLSGLFTWAICVPVIALFAYLSVRIAKQSASQALSLFLVFLVSVFVPLFVGMDVFEVFGAAFGGPAISYVLNSMLAGIGILSLVAVVVRISRTLTAPKGTGA